MYKVLVGEFIDDNAVKILKAQKNIETDIKIGISREEILDIIENYDALIVRSVIKVDKELLDKGKNLKIVGRAGNGIDNIDVKEATNHGVIVANTPDSNTVSACELAIALLLATARNILPADRYLKSGKWEREIFVGNEVFHKTLGIIGLGRIGSLVATRMKAFGMDLIAYDPYISDERFRRYECKKAETLDELLEVSDFVTIHTPKTAETLKIISYDQIKKMKDGVRLVNAARGGVFDEAAVAKGLESGKIASYGFDVHEKEPRSESPLYAFDNVITTPHIGATTHEAQENVGKQVVKQLINGLNGEIVETAVNLPTMGREEFAVIKPYIQFVEKLGKIYYQVKKGAIKFVNLIYYGNISSQETAIIDSSFMKGLLYPVLKEEVNYINSLVLADKRDIKFHSIKKEEKYYNYPDVIKIEVVDEKGEKFSIVGIIGGNQEERIVEINGYPIDVVISENMLLVENNDVPGVIGNVGRILGEESVNIATMHVGRKEDSAIMLLTVDDVVEEKSIKKLEEFEQIRKVKYLNL
ncbi:phosphoglycerate dehydrogenase [Sebaldella sp. S0638]|uniref:phosphoglycerate dehydrogenase n=1 Tax=Sebaldella sp. S0638 TaxID=2957809 RepID=UPI00209F0513|nr:phosphoglycerate dehydrogenase [Sebaldella sp. S0638]MCP1224492.1 phosphoglycerate dehydrogenase [Sebaldella sp. S0638]